jgi:RNA polymerase-binding transcription factor
MAIDAKLALTILEKRREELQDLSALSAESRDPVALDQQSVGRLSRMDAIQVQAMAQEAERRRARDLVRVGEALKRLDDGDYGTCAECDEDIAPKRLEVDPAAALCIKCASRSEA